MTVEINGGITTLEQAQDHLQYVDAVMIGRAAYDTPYLFAEADRAIFGDTRAPRTRAEVARAMMPYIERQLATNPRVKLHHITRHMINLFAGQRGARIWRRAISERHHAPQAGPEVIEEALRAMGE